MTYQHPEDEYSEREFMDGPRGVADLVGRAVRDSGVPETLKGVWKGITATVLGPFEERP